MLPWLQIGPSCSAQHVRSPHHDDVILRQVLSQVLHLVPVRLLDRRCRQCLRVCVSGFVPRGWCLGAGASGFTSQGAEGVGAQLARSPTGAAQGPLNAFPQHPTKEPERQGWLQAPRRLWELPTAGGQRQGAKPTCGGSGALAT